MEEKEMIRRIRNSIKAGKSRAKIFSEIQSKGYKLEYADALFKKAKPHGTWFYFSLILIFALVIMAASFSYALFFQEGTKLNLANPLAGMGISFGSNNLAPGAQEVNIEDIQITPDFISYLLNEIGVTEKLHKNPIGFENPIINLKIDNLLFTSEISRNIETKKGASGDADIQFNTNKRGVVIAILSGNPIEVFRESIMSGETVIQPIAGEAELFSKGYLGLYDLLK